MPLLSRDELAHVGRTLIGLTVLVAFISVAWSQREVAAYSFTSATYWLEDTTGSARGDNRALVYWGNWDCFGGICKVPISDLGQYVNVLAPSGGQFTCWYKKADADDGGAPWRSGSQTLSYYTTPTTVWSVSWGWNGSASDVVQMQAVGVHGTQCTTNGNVAGAHIHTGIVFQGTSGYTLTYGN